MTRRLGREAEKPHSFPGLYQRAHMELSVRNLDAADGRGLRNNEGGTP